MPRGESGSPTFCIFLSNPNRTTTLLINVPLVNMSPHQLDSSIVNVNVCSNLGATEKEILL